MILSVGPSHGSANLYFVQQAKTNKSANLCIVQQAKMNKLANLSGHRFGAHMDASGVWRLPEYPLAYFLSKYMVCITKKQRVLYITQVLVYAIEKCAIFRQHIIRSHNGSRG